MVDSSVLRGSPVVPGVVHAPALVVRTEVSPEAIARFEAPRDADTALAAYDDAVGAVADGFLRTAGATSGDAAKVLTASAGLVRDKALRSAVREHLRSGGDLIAAVRSGVGEFVRIFTGRGGLTAERVADLRDIERRVIAQLVGEPAPEVGRPPAPCVVVAEDLAPSDAAALDPAVVLALVTERGSPTSHTSIIARQLAIPCVVGVAGATSLTDGALVLVDGDAGTVETGAADAEARVAADAERRAAIAAWAGPGRTVDGVPVTILANVADGASARAAAAVPVQGVGLFRTELSFLNRRDEPSVAEQAEVYAEVLAAFGGERYVVVRTLDAGADKPVGYATHGEEENPALGVRGLRLSADNPGLLDRQLDAVAAAATATGTEAWVMAPMVATVAEAEAFAGKVHARGLRAGVMVEVPSAALLAHRILDTVDFLSIGTNDLAQYTMAADRMAADLAHLADAWQPAVLQLVAITAEAGRRARKPVSICGEAAADPLLACVLVGMGVTSLSMAAAAVRPVGARLARTTYDLCEEAAEAALSAADPVAAREAVRALLA